MGKIKLKDRLREKGLIVIQDPHDVYQGGGNDGAVESFSRGGGVHGLGSRIFKGWHKETKAHVALKQIYVAMEEVDDTSEHPVERELEILKRISHPNLVQLDLAYMLPHVGDEVWIVTEFCEGGSIAEAMRQLARPLTESEIREVVRGVLHALAHLHAHGITHRDVKSDNILLRSDGGAVLADLGSAAVGATCTGIIGTSHWMAPEIAGGLAYDNKVDVWSLGITIIEMAEMETPVMRDGGNETVVAIASPALHRPGKWSAELNALVRMSLEMVPAMRPTVEAMLKAKFLTPVEGAEKVLTCVVEELRCCAAKEEQDRQRYREQQRRDGHLPWDDDDVDDDLSSSICSRSMSQSTAALIATTSPNINPAHPPHHPRRSPSSNTINPYPRAEHRDRSRSSDVHFDPVVAPPDLCRDLNEIKVDGEMLVKFTSSKSDIDTADVPGGSCSAAQLASGESRPVPLPPPPPTSDGTLDGSAGQPTPDIRPIATPAELQKENEELLAELAALRRDLPYEAALADEHAAGANRVWDEHEAGFMRPLPKDRLRFPDTQTLEEVMLAERSMLKRREKRFVEDLTRIKKTIEGVQGSWLAMQEKALAQQQGAMHSPTRVGSVPAAARESAQENGRVGGAAGASQSRRARPQRDMTNQHHRPHRPHHHTSSAMSRSHTYTIPKAFQPGSADRSGLRLVSPTGSFRKENRDRGDKGHAEGRDVELKTSKSEETMPQHTHPHTHYHAPPNPPGSGTGTSHGGGSARADGASPLRSEQRHVPGAMRRHHAARQRTKTTVVHMNKANGGGKKIYDKEGRLVWGI